MHTLEEIEIMIKEMGIKYDDSLYWLAQLAELERITEAKAKKIVWMEITTTSTSDQGEDNGKLA